ncbi:MAG: signal peptidase II [Pseudomonadota bacterium]
MRKRHILFFVLLLLVVVDQVSKHWVEAVLPYGQPLSLLPFFSLYRTHNTGIAFSMLNEFGATGLVIMTIIIICLVLVLWSRVPRDQQLAHIGFALVIAGAVGNLIDRATLGYVVDFLMVHTQTWSFAVFNLADSFITIGAVAIIIDELFSLRKGAATTTTPKPKPKLEGGDDAPGPSA